MRNEQFRVTRQPWIDTYEITLGIRNIDGLTIGMPVVMMPHSDAAVVMQPTMSVSSEAAQSLMNELWIAGLRPTVDGREKQPLSSEWAARQLEKFIDAAVGPSNRGRR